MIVKQNFFNNANVGVFSFATDEYCLIPKGLTKRETNRIEKTLHVPCFDINIAQSHIIHTLTIGNKNGLLIPHTATDEEYSVLKKLFDNNKVKNNFSYLYFTFGNAFYRMC